MFYNVNAVKKEKAFVINASNTIEIEISEELPAVKTTAATLNVAYYIGGIKAGTCSCPVEKKFVYPQAIRVAIDINAGYELCRLVVREALIGQAIDNGLSFRERLRIAKKPTKDSVTSV